MSDQLEHTAVTVDTPWSLTRDRNPYLHNIFVLLEIDPDKPQAVFDESLVEADVKIRTGVEWTVNGYKVSSVDTARAEQIARQGVDFVGERLLAHTQHEVDVKEFQEAIKQLDAVPIERPETMLPLPVRDLSEIARNLPQQAEEFVGEAQHFPRERLQELFHPESTEEQIFDL